MNKTQHTPNDAGPLDGILVADFSRVLAGPLCTMFLGDLGADVVKVERPTWGDETRQWGPPFDDQGESAYYLGLNRNKRSIVLDLDDPADHRRAVTLATRADVLVENFRPGTMENLDLSYERLSRDSPGLVYCSISGFGSKAGAELPGYDFLAQALTGLMSITGSPSGTPIKTGVAVVDIFAAHHATIGVLAALISRTKSGRGQRVSVNLMSSGLVGLVNQASNYLIGNQIPMRQGNSHPNIAPYEVFNTATDPIAIAVGNDQQFTRLCEALGEPERSQDVRWATNASRVQDREALAKWINEHLSNQPADDWIALLSAIGVPCGPLNDVATGFQLASDLGLEPIAVLGDDNHSVRTVANPIELSGTPVSYRLPPPSLGEQDTDIASWLDQVSRGSSR